MSKIIRLQVNNLLRISAAEIKPDGSPLVIVAGKNQQGKSSLLDSIAIALSGKDLPKEPIKRGAASASIILETDEYIVTRTFSQTGGAKLEVRDREGARLTSPQTKLDALYTRTTFDPLTFVHMKPLEQADTVRRIVGLDFAKEEEDRAKLYNDRTAIGRDLKSAQARRDGIQRDTSAPTAEISVAELAEKLEKAQQINRGIENRKTALSQMLAETDRKAAEVYEAEAAVEDAKRAVENAEGALQRAKIVLDNQRQKAEAESVALAEVKDEDTDGIRTQIQNAENTNQRVRANAGWDREHKEVTRLQGEQSRLTGLMEAIDSKKAKALESAKFPIDGLAFNESGVTFNGLAFEQASSAEKIRVSLAIAVALNPTLRVMLIKDGSLLDEDNLALIGTFAAEHDATVFLECVGNREDATVIIEDGQVASTPKADAKAKAKGDQLNLGAE